MKQNKAVSKSLSVCTFFYQVKETGIIIRRIAKFFIDVLVSIF
jgi:hypothetical protein